MKTRSKIVALYIRLSEEDEDLDELKRESNSVTNQRLMLRQFIKEHPDLEAKTVIEFADDGFSGTNFGRPRFNAMVKEIVSGNVECVIVKDFSRFARNYIEAGNYLEKVFPMYQIRFISINDGYDSDDYKGKTGGLEMAFKNYMNTMYAKDLSIRVTTTRTMMAREGKFTGSHAPYGYMKDPDDCHRLIIDEEAAAVVRRVFQMAADGVTKNEIARTLNEEGVMTIIEYARAKGYGRKWVREKEKKLWTNTTIGDMIKKEVYIGTTISNKYKRTSIGARSQRKSPEAEWIRVENTHDPIVEKSLFEQANLMASMHTTPRKAKAVKPVLFMCASCGRTMSLNGSGKAYRCQHAALTNLPDCKKIKYPKTILENEVLQTVREKSQELLNEIKKNKSSWKRDVKEYKWMEALREKEEKLTQKKMRLYDLFRDEKMDRDTYGAKSLEVSLELMKIRDKLREKEERSAEAASKLAGSVEIEKTLKKVMKLDTFDTEVLKLVLDKVVLEEDSIEYFWLNLNQ